MYQSDLLRNIVVNSVFPSQGIPCELRKRPAGEVKPRSVSRFQLTSWCVPIFFQSYQQRSKEKSKMDEIITSIAEVGKAAAIAPWKLAKILAKRGF